MSQGLRMGRGGEGGSRLSTRWGGPGGGTGWYCTSSADGTRHVLGSYIWLRRYHLSVVSASLVMENEWNWSSREAGLGLVWTGQIP